MKEKCSKKNNVRKKCKTMKKRNIFIHLFFHIELPELALALIRNTSRPPFEPLSYPAGTNKAAWMFSGFFWIPTVKARWAMTIIQATKMGW